MREKWDDCCKLLIASSGCCCYRCYHPTGLAEPAYPGQVAHKAATTPGIVRVLGGARSPRRATPVTPHSTMASDANAGSCCPPGSWGDLQDSSDVANQAGTALALHTGTSVYVTPANPTGTPPSNNDSHLKCNCHGLPWGLCPNHRITA